MAKELYAVSVYPKPFLSCVMKGARRDTVFVFNKARVIARVMPRQVSAIRTIAAVLLFSAPNSVPAALTLASDKTPTLFQSPVLRPQTRYGISAATHIAVVSTSPFAVKAPAAVRVLRAGDFESNILYLRHIKAPASAYSALAAPKTSTEPSGL